MIVKTTYSNGNIITNNCKQSYVVGKNYYFELSDNPHDIFNLHMIPIDETLIVKIENDNNVIFERNNYYIVSDYDICEERICETPRDIVNILPWILDHAVIMEHTVAVIPVINGEENYGDNKIENIVNTIIAKVYSLYCVNEGME